MCKKSEMSPKIWKEIFYSVVVGGGDGYVVKVRERRRRRREEPNRKIVRWRLKGRCRELEYIAPIRVKLLAGGRDGLFLPTHLVRQSVMVTRRTVQVPLVLVGARARPKCH